MNHPSQDGFLSRLRALELGLWTPERVEQRMILTYDVLFRSNIVSGAKGHSQAWGSIVRTWEDLVDPRTRERIRNQHIELAIQRGINVHAVLISIDWRQYVDGQTIRQLADDEAEVIRLRRKAPTKLEVELAEEAAEWPARFLGDSPLLSDALQLWAMCRAQGWSLAKRLRDRAKAADAMVERRKQETPDELHVYRDELQEAAAKVAEWANGRLAKAKTPAEAATIRDEARAMMGRRARRERMLERVVHVKRSDVMPGKTFSESSCERARKHGSALLSDRLNRGGVAMRVVEEV